MNNKHAVIVDCDPGIDDSLALLLLLKSPEINIVGITTVSGNVPAELGAKNVFKVLKLTDRLDIPVYIGASNPLTVPYVSAQDTHGDDGLGNSRIPPVKVQAKHGAIDFILRTFQNAPQTELLVLGPMTNIAMCLRQDPHIFDQTKRLIAMGGNYASFGNCSPVAEYNFWCDPHAAKEVFTKSHVKIEMVGLDVTRKIVLTPNILEYIKQVGGPIADFIKKITRFYIDFHWQQEGLIGCVINDPLAAACLLLPDLLSGFASYTKIAATGTARGESIVDAHDFWHKKPNSYIYTKVDQKSFWTLFLSRVIGISPTEIAKVLVQLGVEL